MGALIAYKIARAREVEQCKKHLLQYVFAGPFEWVMAWRDMLPAHHYSSMLDQHLGTILDIPFNLKGSGEFNEGNESNTIPS